MGGGGNYGIVSPEIKGEKCHAIHFIEMHRELRHLTVAYIRYLPLW